MAQALTNKKFIEQMDDVIEELGGTPTNLQLTADKEDDMLSNGAFVAKMDEVVEALGGTPAELTISDDEADDMVSDHIFQLKMEDVVKNMSGGGGGGGSEFNTAQVTVASPYQNFDLNDYTYEQPPYGYSCFAVENGQILTGRIYVSGEDSKTYTLYYLGDSITLYVGTAYISSSGNVTYDESTNSVTITGDCTVTGYIDD